MGEFVEGQPDLQQASKEILVSLRHVVACEQAASQFGCSKFEFREILSGQLDIEVMPARTQGRLGEVGLHQVRDGSGRGPPCVQHLVGGDIPSFTGQQVNGDGCRVRTVVLDIRVEGKPRQHTQDQRFFAHGAGGQLFVNPFQGVLELADDRLCAFERQSGGQCDACLDRIALDGREADDLDGARGNQADAENQDREDGTEGQVPPARKQGCRRQDEIIPDPHQHAVGQAPGIGLGVGPDMVHVVRKHQEGLKQARTERNQKNDGNHLQDGPDFA